MVEYELRFLGEVREFIDNLGPTDRARIDRYLELFRTYGQSLPPKYLKKIAPNVWELRPGPIRLFFTIKGSTGYVVHAIRKKTQKTPRRDIELALKRIR